MAIPLDDFFDAATLHRAQVYVQSGYVLSLTRMPDGAWQGLVSNGRGDLYHQSIFFSRDGFHGTCSCPMAQNCKHVAAVLLSSANLDQTGSTMSDTLRAWLNRVKTYTPSASAIVAQVDDYPPTVRDRLLYVLSSTDARLKIDIFKGRRHARENRLDPAIRRYDAEPLLRGNVPAQFVRPGDLKLLAWLAHEQIWTPYYRHAGRSGLLRLEREELTNLIRSLCKTGRFLQSPEPNQELTWSDECHALRFGWQMTAEGAQRLHFEDAAGRPLALYGIDGRATFWIDLARREIGMMAEPVDDDLLRLIRTGPDLQPRDLVTLAATLPETLAGLPIPRPRNVRERQRKAQTRFPRLTLGMAVGKIRDGYWSFPVNIPVLTLRFVYDGHEVGDGDGNPRFFEAGEIVTLTRDAPWESICLATLVAAGAVPVEDLLVVEPSAKMMTSDFVLVNEDDDLTQHQPRTSQAALDFAFRVVPELRARGWEIIETPQWPFRLSETEVKLAVATYREAGEAFQDNGWFSIGFHAEIDGKRLDIAPLIAAFLEQMGEQWEAPKDLESLETYLSKAPIYLAQGTKGYIALDLSPLAKLLHLFLIHQGEFGALHPGEAPLARLAEEALSGSSVRFSDHAGILPLAHCLDALSKQAGLTPPKGLHAQLRDYQAFGAGWMQSLLASGFGGILADDMGLGKTLQALCLLEARRAAGEKGPTLLIVPTSLLHGWQMQAAQFTPQLRLVLLHGADRLAEREKARDADVVLTTYPLLSRDRKWLSAQEWPLVILDEAQILKNPAAQMVKALRDIPAKGRIALTGTPLENSLRDLWTLVDWINPGLLGNRKQFQQLFQTPIEKHNDSLAQARLNRRLRPFLLRRTKEQVAAELPPRTEIFDWVSLDHTQQALYESVRSAMDKRVREAIASRGLAGARITVLDALLKLRQVCCDPKLVKSDAAQMVTISAKRIRLRELLTELIAEGRRVLVFSQFVELLRLIEQDLAELGIGYLTLTGETRNRAELIEGFHRKNVPVFLLSLKAGGLGLTLTQADTVILYDPWWNPAVERQAMDRAHRIGQTKPVFVHRLVATGTVEEKILALQAKKQSLADALFDEAGETDHAFFDEATLQDLFAPLGPQ